MNEQMSLKARKQPKQARARATVDVILRATAHILSAEGYSALTTNRVAEVAGVSIGSLYQYFPNKQTLVSALIDKHCEALITVLGEQLMNADWGGCPKTLARTVIKAMVEAHQVDPVLHGVLTQQVPAFGHDQRLRILQEQSAALVVNFLRGSPELCRRPDLDLAALIVVQAVDASTHEAVLHHTNYLEDDQLVDELTDLVHRYLVRDDYRPPT